MPADRFIHRGWSFRRVERNDNQQTWAIYEKGQRKGVPRGYVWKSSNGFPDLWLYQGGKSAIADARVQFETAIDNVIALIEAHRPQFGGSR